MNFAIRPGTHKDIPAVMSLLDMAGDWLVGQGRTGQWGSDRQSTHPRRIAQAKEWVQPGRLHLAELDGVPVGALVVGKVPPMLPAAKEPEIYVNLLVSSRERSGSRVGARLLEHAVELAKRAGCELVRLDCYDGDDRKLVRYYEGQGFKAVQTVHIDLPNGTVWTGQMLERRVSAPAD